MISRARRYTWLSEDIEILNEVATKDRFTSGNQEEHGNFPEQGRGGGGGGGGGGPLFTPAARGHITEDGTDYITGRSSQTRIPDNVPRKPSDPPGYIRADGKWYREAYESELRTGSPSYDKLVFGDGSDYIYGVDKKQYIETSTPPTSLAGKLPTKRRMTSDRNEWLRDLPKSERDSILDYTNWDYEVNENLRGGTSVRDLSESHQVLVKNLDSAISHSTLATDTTLYRSVGPERFSNRKVGSSFVDRGYVSTSRTADAAASISGSEEMIRVAITVPKGNKAAYVESISEKKHEEEVLLPRNTRFRVTAVARNGVTTEMEVVK